MDKIRQKLKMYAHHPASFLLALLVWISAIFTAVTLIFIVGYILIKGVPHLTPQLFELEYNSENVSMFPAIINTIFMIMLSLLVAGPLGIFAAVYLVEYAKREINWCLLCA